MREPFRGKNVRWYDANGKRVKPNTPGATKEVTETDRYYGFVTTDSGKPKKVKLFRTLTESRDELRKLQHKADRRASGIDDDQMEHAKRPLEEHLRGWKESLDGRPITQERRELMVGRMNRLLKASGWERLSNITEDTLLVALKKLKAKDGRHISARTRNHYLRHVKQFIRWCRKTGRLANDPLVGLSSENVATDSRHDRRALTLDEQKRLLKTTAASTVIRHKMDGTSRAMLYRLLLATGLRRDELKSLTPESFNLAAGTITLAAEFSKNRRPCVLKVPSPVDQRIREWFALGKPLWNHLTDHTAKMLKRDLKAAGIPYVTKDADGRPLYADFHAFRHTFCTAVAETGARLGITIKSQMKMTRHETVELYMKTYVKENPKDMDRIAAAFPDPLGADTEQQQAAG